MSNGNDSNLGRGMIRDWVFTKIRRVGQKLSIPNSRQSPRPPAPSSSPDGKPLAEASTTSYPQALSTANTPPIARPRVPGHKFAISTVTDPTGAGSATSFVSSVATGQPATTPPTLAQAAPTPAAPLQTLSPPEIRQRTADLLKN